jgi:cytochrome P450
VTLVHPLRGFPGPRIASVSRIPYWNACLTGNQVRWVQRLHVRYGPVVRYGPNDLSYADGQAWKDIYGYEKGRQENPKDRRFFGPPRNGVYSMITADIDGHAKVRRILSAAFSERALKQQESLFQKYADLMVSKISQSVTRDSALPLDMVKMLNLTTFDLMSDLTFGESLGLLEKNEYTPWVELIFKSIAVLPIVQIMEYYPLLKTIFKLLEPKSIADVRLSHFQHSTERVDRRLREGSSKPDIWNLVISANGDRALTLQEMHANAEIFMIAGTETTATLLSGLIYFLLTDTKKMKTLTDEIRSAFASNASITWDGLTALEYMNACLEEALRMYPPVPSALPRITPEGGNVILGRWIAPGVSPLD